MKAGKRIAALVLAGVMDIWKCDTGNGSECKGCVF